MSSERKALLGLALGVGVILCGIAVAIAPLALVPPAVVLCVVMSARSGTATSGVLSPMRLFLPLFIVYNVLSLVLSHTATTAYQAALYGLAALAFVIGYTLVMRSPARAPEHTDRSALSAGLGPILGLLAIALPLMAILVARGGIPVLAKDVNSARVAFFPNGYITTAIVVPTHVVLIVSLIALGSPQSRRRRIALVLAAACCVGMLVATADRGQLIGPILIYALYRLWHHPVRLIVLLTIVAVVFPLFSYTGYQRSLTAYGPSYDADLTSLGYGGSLRYLAPAFQYIGGTSVALDKTIDIFPQRLPHPYGQEFFGPLLHQPSADLYLKEVLGYSFVGAGVALGGVNAFYLDFGLPGVVLGFLIFGAISGILYRRAQASGGRWVMAYCLWLANLLLSLYAHPFAYLSTVLDPLLVLMLLRPLGSPLPLAGDHHQVGPEPRPDQARPRLVREQA